MPERWIYNQAEYSTLEAAQEAVSTFKTRLENNPTDWVEIKEVTSDSNGGWIVSNTVLTDSEIYSMSDDKRYNVSSVQFGYSGVALTGSEATSKVSELRTEYARFVGANSITKLVEDEYIPTEDMSGYV